MIRVLLTILAGVLLGGVFALPVLGLNLVFGVLRIVNVAHGSLFAIGAYAAASVGAFFAALADPVRQHEGSVDDYVGDMALVTWPLRRGLKDAQCIACVFAIEDAIAATRAAVSSSPSAASAARSRWWRPSATVTAPPPWAR